MPEKPSSAAGSQRPQPGPITQTAARQASHAHAADRHLDVAERRRLCLVATSPGESRLLRRGVQAGAITCVRRGMFSRTGYWGQLDPCERALHMARTLSLRHRSWVISHASAALVHGMGVPYRIASPIHFVTHSRGGGRLGPGLVHHRCDALEWDVFDGVRATSPVRTVCDCAATYPLPDALAIADSALRSGIVTREQLEAHLAGRPGSRGVARSRRVVALADSRAESGGESAARGTLIELGYEIYDLQLVVDDLEVPGRTYRLDIVLRDSAGRLVALEVDGRVKYERLAEAEGIDSVEMMMRERQREARVTAHGIPVVRISGKDVFDKDLIKRRLAAYGVYPQGTNGPSA